MQRVQKGLKRTQKGKGLIILPSAIRDGGFAGICACHLQRAVSIPI